MIKTMLEKEKTTRKKFAEDLEKEREKTDYLVEEEEEAKGLKTLRVIEQYRTRRRRSILGGRKDKEKVC